MHSNVGPSETKRLRGLRISWDNTMVLRNHALRFYLKIKNFLVNKEDRDERSCIRRWPRTGEMLGAVCDVFLVPPCPVTVTASCPQPGVWMPPSPGCPPLISLPPSFSSLIPSKHHLTSGKKRESNVMSLDSSIIWTRIKIWDNKCIC